MFKEIKSDPCEPIGKVHQQIVLLYSKQLKTFNVVFPRVSERREIERDDALCQSEEIILQSTHQQL